MGKRDNIVGNIYGRLIVLQVVGKTVHGKYQVECLCDCGNLCIVLEASLKRGYTSSCGCVQAFNQRKRKDNTSGKVGVSEKNGKWVARIWKDKILYELGVFNNKEEAIAARCKAEIDLYGFMKEG